MSLDSKRHVHNILSQLSYAIWPNTGLSLSSVIMTPKHIHIYSHQYMHHTHLYIFTHAKKHIHIMCVSVCVLIPRGLYVPAPFTWLLCRIATNISRKYDKSLPSSLESLESPLIYPGGGFCTPFFLWPFCRYLIGRCCTPLGLRIARLVSNIIYPGDAFSCHVSHTVKSGIKYIHTKYRTH